MCLMHCQVQDDVLIRWGQLGTNAVISDEITLGSAGQFTVTRKAGTGVAVG